jgi:putative DNA primase/helicase
MTLDALPREIRESTRAVVWRTEQRGPSTTKAPYRARDPRAHASVVDPRTWAPFTEALTVVQRGMADGVGLVLGAGIAGVDLDHVRDGRTGAVSDDVLAIVRTLDSYTEVSPSGTGLHVLVRGTLPPGRRRAGYIEMYDAGRFFTITARHVAGTPHEIHERTDALAALHLGIFGTEKCRLSAEITPSSKCTLAPATITADDAALIARAIAARNGSRFAALWAGDTAGYPSPSEADLALCSLLSWWTGRDAARVDRLFRQSGLYRPKWDEPRGAQTYGDATISKALR